MPQRGRFLVHVRGGNSKIDAKEGEVVNFASGVCRARFVLELETAWQQVIGITEAQ
jgi:hypothetical protein